VFSKLDLARGYHQFHITMYDRHKTTIVKLDGFCEWIVILVGLPEALSAFMRAMLRIVGPYWKFELYT